MEERKSKSIGGAWKKTSAKGMEFLSLSITIDGVERKFVAFPNDKGDNPKRPDYSILLSEDRGTPAPAPAPAYKESKYEPLPAGKELPF